MKWEQETALALQAVAEGARIAQDRPARLGIQTKESLRDIVSTVDVAIEQAIRKILAGSSHAFIGEESGESVFPLPDTPVWVVDPIDGTVNYANGLSSYAVSVGLCQGSEFLVGAVCLPDLNELFCTFSDDRALLNGKPLIHTHVRPEASLVSASFSGDRGDPALRQQQYILFGAINDSTMGCLRTGSAISNICNVAANRMQATYGLGAKIWDVAGALAIARRAGCVIHVSPAARGRVDYIVGSSETVAMIHTLCVENNLMEPSCN